MLNFIIIYATALLSKNKIKRINFILSSCFGSLCSIVEYVIGIGKYLEFLFEVIISILMVMIAFNVKKKSKILLNLLYFYLVSIAFGGMSFMILFFNPEAFVYKDSTYTMEIVSVGAIISFVLVVAIAIIIKIRDQKRSELIEIENGYLVDSPGFSNIDISFMNKDNLRYSFPEFDEYNHRCKFRGCLHNKEPECAVKKALSENKINEYRYNFYIRILEELQEGEKYKW